MAVMLAHDFKVVTISRLVRNGLARVTMERVRAGERTLELTKVRITDAGRAALNSDQS